MYTCSGYVWVMLFFASISAGTRANHWPSPPIVLVFIHDGGLYTSHSCKFLDCWKDDCLLETWEFILTHAVIHEINSIYATMAFSFCKYDVYLCACVGVCVCACMRAHATTAVLIKTKVCVWIYVVWKLKSDTALDITHYATAHFSKHYIGAKIGHDVSF